jgi:hypothetical protein
VNGKREAPGEPVHRLLFTVYAVWKKRSGRDSNPR